MPDIELAKEGLVAAMANLQTAIDNIDSANLTSDESNERYLVVRSIQEGIGLTIAVLGGLGGLGPTETVVEVVLPMIASAEMSVASELVLAAHEIGPLQ